MTASYKLSLSVQYATRSENLPTRHQFRRWVKSALQRDVQIALRLVNDVEARELNKRFRGKDYATNVLTFVYDDGDPLSGDVVICVPVVEREAREQQKELHAHFAHLAIHATLHLQGYDHENENEAVAMEARETAIMMKLGYANPYQAVTE
jgi:probable rRNA maturation factor